MTDIRNKLVRSQKAFGPTPLANAYFCSQEKCKIIEVSREHIFYTDMTGSPKKISLISCSELSNISRDYVGERGLLSIPAWIEFSDSNRTRFEFETRWLAYNLVLHPLENFNLKTLDRD